MSTAWSGLRRELRQTLAILLAILAILWTVQLVNVVWFGGALVRWGVEPRSVEGLPGIVLHPFLHGSWAHLISNTIGFLMLGGLVLLREQRDFWTVSILATLVGGIGIWLVGRPGPHIGISGVIFGYFGYLLLTGVFDRKIGAFLLSLLTFLIWGRLLLGLSPLQRGISWEGHLLGLAGGITGAWLRATRRRGQ
jgi:membrane associated rhomboid family serine protease